MSASPVASSSCSHRSGTMMNCSAFKPSASSIACSSVLRAFGCQRDAFADEVGRRGDAAAQARHQHERRVLKDRRQRHERTPVKPVGQDAGSAEAVLGPAGFDLPARPTRGRAGAQLDVEVVLLEVALTDRRIHAGKLELVRVRQLQHDVLRLGFGPTGQRGKNRGHHCAGEPSIKGAARHVGQLDSSRICKNRAGFVEEQSPGWG